jgi:energy-coupling factor transport system ATP-binding protein
MDALIDQSLQRLGITALRQRHLTTLSGGELQKVSLAITLAMGSDLIILDEPFASIDLKSRQALLQLLKELQQTEHKTILITDHDLSGYQNLIDQLYHFEHGQVTPVADPAAVFNTFATYQQAFHFKLPVGEEPLLEITQLGLKTPAKTLLAATNLTIFKGKLCLLTGENGCGKSTFFAALTRLHDFEGTILYQNQSILKYKARDFAKQVALVFQDAQLQYLKLTLQEELALSLKHARFPELWDDAVLTDYLTRLHLDQLREQVIYQLSGGQKKKLQILEMLILGSPVLLMDEPLAGLDIDSLQVVIDLVRTMAQKQQQTIIMISHQLSGLQAYFDYHLTLADHQLTYTELITVNKNIE